MSRENQDPLITASEINRLNELMHGNQIARRIDEAIADAVKEGKVKPVQPEVAKVESSIHTIKSFIDTLGSLIPGNSKQLGPQRSAMEEQAFEAARGAREAIAGVDKIKDNLRRNPNMPVNIIGKV